MIEVERNVLHASHFATAPDLRVVGDQRQQMAAPQRLDRVGLVIHEQLGADDADRAIAFGEF